MTQPAIPQEVYESLTEAQRSKLYLMLGFASDLIPTLNDQQKSLVIHLFTETVKNPTYKEN